MVSNLLLQLTRLSVYASLIAPLLVNSRLFFPFITGKALFFRFFAELGLLGLVLILAASPDFRQQVLNKIKNPVFLAITVFTAIFLLTSLTAINPQLAFWSNFERAEGGWQVIHYFLFFILAYLLFNSQESWSRLLSWQVIIGTLVAGYALLQNLNPPPYWVIDPPGRPSGTLGNASYLSIYLIFNLFFIAWLTLIRVERQARWFWYGLGIFQILAIILLAQNRASIIALSLGLIIFLLGVSWQFFRNNRRRWAGIIFLAVLLIALAGGWLTTFIKGGQPLQALQARLWVWQSVWAGFREKPILGWGMENFPILFDKYYNPNHFGRESFFDRAHNVFLEYASSGGIILLLAYLAIFYLFFKQALFSEKKYLAIIPFIYLVNGLVLFEVLPLYLMLFLYLAFALNSLGNFSHLNLQPTTYNQKLITYLIPILSAIILLFSFYHTLYRPFQKNRLIYQLAIVSGPVEKIIEAYDEALNYQSVIGQQELLQQLFNDSNNYPSALLIDFTDRWFRQERQQLVGVRELYLHTMAMVKTAALTNDQKYRERAGELIAEGRQLAPNRLEFIIEGIKLARLEEDQKIEKELLALAKKLRPDLKLEDFIK